MARKCFLQLSDLFLMVILSEVHSLADMDKFQQYTVHDVIYVYFIVS